MVFLTFFGTWSAPSRSAFPALNEKFNKFKDKGLAVIGVTNETEEELAKFTKSTKIDFPVSSNPPLVAKYYVKLWPQSYLIGRNGVVVWEGPPWKLDNSTIERVLNGAAAQR